MLLVQRKGNSRLNAGRRIVRPKRTDSPPGEDPQSARGGLFFLRHLFLGRDVEDKFPSLHQFGMFDTGVLKHLTVEGHLLEMRTLTLQRAAKRLTVIKLQGPRWQQRGMKQIVALACIGIESEHMESKPGGHRTTIVITRQTVGCVIVVLGDNLPHTV